MASKKSNPVHIRVDSLSDEEYHKLSPLEEHYYSSSQIKTAKANLKLFHREAVLGLKKPFSPVTQDAFTVGHYFHSFFLEPETLSSYAIWDAPKRGKVWQDFQEENKDKRILSASMREQSEILIQGVDQSAPCKEILSEPFKSEVSFFSEIEGLKVKCRFDILHEMDGYAIGGDLKSTQETDLDNEDVLRKTISKLGYALSYALYRDIYENVTGKPMKSWYWIFASKGLPSAKLVWASEEYYQLGRAQYLEGIRKIKELQKDKWEYKDKAIMLKPSSFELSQIKNLEDTGL